MLPSNDVINVKWQGIPGVRQMTILAPSLRTLPDLPGKLPVHEFERSRGFLFRARRALDCMTASRFPTCR